MADYVCGSALHGMFLGNLVHQSFNQLLFFEVAADHVKDNAGCNRCFLGVDFQQLGQDWSHESLEYGRVVVVESIPDLQDSGGQSVLLLKIYVLFVFLQICYYFVLYILKDGLIVDSQQRDIFYNTCDCIDIPLLKEVTEFFLTLLVMFLHLVDIGRPCPVDFDHQHHNKLKTLLKLRVQSLKASSHNLLKKVDDEVLQIIDISYKILTIDKFIRSISIFHKEGVEISMQCSENSELVEGAQTINILLSQFDEMIPNADVNDLQFETCLHPVYKITAASLIEDSWGQIGEQICCLPDSVFVYADKGSHTCLIFMQQLNIDVGVVYCLYAFQNRYLIFDSRQKLAKFLACKFVYCSIQISVEDSGIDIEESVENERRAVWNEDRFERETCLGDKMLKLFYTIWQH